VIAHGGAPRTPDNPPPQARVFGYTPGVPYDDLPVSPGTAFTTF